MAYLSLSKAANLTSTCGGYELRLDLCNIQRSKIRGLGTVFTIQLSLSNGAAQCTEKYFVLIHLVA